MQRRQIAVLIGRMQAVALAVYALSIQVDALRNGTHGASGSDVAPIVLVLTYIAFALLLGLVTQRLQNGSDAAKRPFLLGQAFAIVIAQALVAADTIQVKAVAILLIAAAVIAAYCTLTIDK